MHTPSMSLPRLLLSTLAFGLAAAQNQFTMATVPDTIHAGQPFNITWQATTPGTVSIYLVQGPSSDTKFVEAIGSNITNSGALLWTPSSSIKSGPSYALEILADSSAWITNYSKQFAIDGGSSVDSTTNSNSTSSAATSTMTAGGNGTMTTGSRTPGMSTATKTSSGTGTATGSASGTAVPNSNSNAAERVGAGSLGALVVVGVWACLM